jgi:hypothetical protein
MLPTPGAFLPPSPSAIHLLTDDVVWIASSICCICLPQVAKDSFSAHSPLFLMFTWLLGEMLDVARYGLQWGTLRLYIKIGWFDQFEQLKIVILTVICLAIVMLTVHHNLIVNVWVR